MKKFRKMRAISLVAVLAVCISLLSGCGIFGFDAESYVMGGLNALYHGEVSDKYLRLVVDSREDCMAMYEENILNEAKNFGQMFYVYINDEPDEELISLYRDVFARSKYEVGEAVETDSGYTVPVTVYPIDLFVNCTAALDEYDSEFTERFSKGEFEGIDGSELQRQYLLAMIEILTAALPDSGYLDPVTVELRLTENSDGVYVISDDDYAELHKNIIAY